MVRGGCFVCILDSLGIGQLDTLGNTTELFLRVGLSFQSSLIVDVAILQRSDPFSFKPRTTT